MSVHLVRGVSLTAFLLLCSVLPFLPGPHDSLALALSAMALGVGKVGLLLVPVGIGWFLYESRKRPRWRRESPAPDKSYWFAMAALGASALLGLAAFTLAVQFSAASLGIGILCLWGYMARRVARRIRLMKRGETKRSYAAPLSVALIPLAVAILQSVIAGPATQYSRNRAILNSAGLIDDIEEFRIVNGRYPLSLHSLSTDYRPSVIGIQRYFYEPSGEAYNLYFEQPTFVLDARVIVMYNKLDQYQMTSHDADLLTRSTSEQSRMRGYYAVQALPNPHWKQFLFD